MRARNVLFAVAAIAAMLSPALAQARRIGAGGGTIGTKKAALYFQTYLEPGVPDLKDYGGGGMSGFGAWSEDGTKFQVHRFIRDTARRVYFGYDITVEGVAEPNMYRVTLSRLTLSPEKYREMVSDNRWNLLPIPGWSEPAARTVREGEVLAVTLLTNNATGQKIVDYFTVQEAPRAEPGFNTLNTPPREFRYSPGPPRDFRAEDAELRIQAPRVSINGKFESSASQVRHEVAGQAVWLYFPNRGRYILSLSPRPDLGFRKAGEIRGSTLSFTAGGETFNVVCGASIAPGAGVFNVYVFHDPAWRPSYAHGEQAFNMGAEDRAEWLIQKQ